MSKKTSKHLLNMEVGQELRIFTRLGIQTKEHWQKAVFLGYSTGGYYKVRFSNREHRQIKDDDMEIFIYEGLKETDYVSFLRPNFDKLCNFLNKECASFNISIADAVMVNDKDELSFSLPLEGISVVASTMEITCSLTHRIKVVPAWEVQVEVHYPGSRDEPPDWDITSKGSSQNHINAGLMFINTIVQNRLNQLAEQYCMDGYED